MGLDQNALEKLLDVGSYEKILEDGSYESLLRLDKMVFKKVKDAKGKINTYYVGIIEKENGEIKIKNTNSYVKFDSHTEQLLAGSTVPSSYAQTLPFKK